ncbi:MAG TPA: FKBP-type peptidyl-prolyl cis-trans isomerase [Candidatus Absconditabacterales bacterium]|nr:FKBP-type peptidyl-prolyl cis-trans isomerase [Candidatus Absconditabacterales bacterium]
MKKLRILPILAISLLILSGCNKQTISEGDTVTVSYESYLQNGTEIEKDIKKEFVIGMGQTFPAFDTELIGMKRGETKEFVASAENGYGVYYEANKVQNITSTVFNKIGTEPKVGEEIELGNLKGLVLEVTPITVKVDFNEIQTREDIKFKVKILEVE